MGSVDSPKTSLRSAMVAATVAMASLGCASAPQTSSSGTGDPVASSVRDPVEASPDRERTHTDIASYLVSACTDGREHHVFYVPHSRTLVEVGTDRCEDEGAVCVGVDNERALELIAAEPHLVEAHCHVPGPENLAHRWWWTDEDRRRRFEALSPEVTAGRLFHEYPSPFQRYQRGTIEGDMAVALSFDVHAMSAHHDGSVRHLIVVVGDPHPRVVEYGVTRDTLATLRTFYLRHHYYRHRQQDIDSSPEGHRVGRAYDDDALRNRMLFDNKIQHYIESYRKLWAAYQEARCDPWEAGDCVEPSLGDFIEILREHGNFFILDHGFVEIPEGWNGLIVRP